MKFQAAEMVPEWNFFLPLQNEGITNLLTGERRYAVLLATREVP
jgi:hypothetical protein